MEIKECIKFKVFAYDVIRMEEDEENDKDFWMKCARYCFALRKFYMVKMGEKWKISECCKFLHALSMYHLTNGGNYSIKKRFVGLHAGVDPHDIEHYMDQLDEFYVKNYKRKNISVLIYFIFESIHPFSDGNGRIGKALVAFLENKIECKIKTKKQHRKLCEILGVMQRNEINLFDVKYCNQLYTLLLE